MGHSVGRLPRQNVRPIVSENKEQSDWLLESSLASPSFVVLSFLRCLIVFFFFYSSFRFSYLVFLFSVFAHAPPPHPPHFAHVTLFVLFVFGLSCVPPCSQHATYLVPHPPVGLSVTPHTPRRVAMQERARVRHLHGSRSAEAGSIATNRTRGR